jgi:hypothetical protein
MFQIDAQVLYRRCDKAPRAMRASLEADGVTSAPV